MALVVRLKAQKILKKVDNPKTGLFAAQDWHRLMQPYTPRDTGNLMRNVEFSPWKITYKAPYASTVYHNVKKVKFVQSGTGRNPYATDHWDLAAANCGQLDKLYRDINSFQRRESAQ